MAEMSEAEKFNRQLVEACPFRIGSRVTIRPTYEYARDWPGEYVVVSLQWDYRNSPAVNVGIATDDEIRNRYGWTDGFTVDDLWPAYSAHEQEPRR